MSGLLLRKTASDKPQVSYSLRGRLYLSPSNWLMLSVPNSVVRGFFDALHEPGAELWLDSRGKLEAHISVMRSEEVEAIGPDNITERGHTFGYTLGPLKKVNPPMPGYNAVWFITVKSPELEALRKSYGLTKRPMNNEYEFHITIGRRKVNVLRPNPVSKAAASVEVVEQRPRVVAVDLDGTLAKDLPEYDPKKIGDPRPGAKKWMEEFARLAKVVVHTCRADEKLVRRWLRKHDIPFDYINENPWQPPDTSDKLYADVYYDNRAVNAAGRLAASAPQVLEKLSAETPYWQRALASQIQQPAWDPGDSMLGNLGLNLALARRRGHDMIQDRRTAMDMQAAFQPGFAMSRLQSYLRHGDPVVQDTADKVLLDTQIDR